MTKKPHTGASIAHAIGGAALRSAQAVAEVLASAHIWMFALVLAGMAAIVAGVFMIYGIGAALLAAGVACLILAALIFLGIRHA